MQLGSVNSQSFTGCRAKVSSMTTSQSDVVNEIKNILQKDLDILSNTDKNGVDIVLLGTNNKAETLFVRFLDRYSGKFFNTKHLSLNCLGYNSKQKLSFLQKFAEYLENICNGSISRPKYDVNDIIMRKCGIFRNDKHLANQIKDVYKQEGSKGVLRAYEKYMHNTDDVIMYEF